jgi:hypothetical protein
MVKLTLFVIFLTVCNQYGHGLVIKSYGHGTKVQPWTFTMIRLRDNVAIADPYTDLLNLDMPLKKGFLSLIEAESSIAVTNAPLKEYIDQKTQTEEEKEERKCKPHICKFRKLALVMRAMK